jgi:pyruvate formate lyase activating enzyme
VKCRQFIRNAAGASLVIGAGFPSLCLRVAAAGQSANLSHQEARYYQKLPDREIQCKLCPRTCRLGDKERGYCGVRENQGGTYYTLIYGKACCCNVDPIEKKPFFHFLPGTNALSIATAGCNLNCKFCQNWQISQVRPEQVGNIDLFPDDVVERAKAESCPSIAYTYTEPVIFFEYMYDTAVRARRKGLKSVVVTAGHIETEPLRDLIGVVDAIKVDLKAFTQDFYANYVRGELKTVLETIRTIGKSKVWFEIVYLVIPTLNDRADRIREMAKWVKGEVGENVPLHFSRFQPMYLMRNLPPTPISTLEMARDTAFEEGLRFVYVGNVPGHAGESTYCPHCRKVVVQRFGYRIEDIHIRKGTCKYCGTPIPGNWT